MDVIEAKERERERRRGIWPFSASTGRMMGTVDGGLRQGKARQCKGMMLHACRHVPELCTLPMSFGPLWVRRPAVGPQRRSRVSTQPWVRAHCLQKSVGAHMEDREFAARKEPPGEGEDLDCITFKG